MKILVCNERFLFRFGVDRVLLILAGRWKALGHEIILMGNKYEAETAGAVCDRFIPVPEAPSYIDSNEFLASYIEERWSEWFGDSGDPDVTLVAGWPFYEALPFLASKCSRLIYHDHGAVPLDGMDGGSLAVQNRLRHARLKNLRHCDKIIAVSDFIKNTQSKLQNPGIETVTAYNGADHLGEQIWKKSGSAEEEKFLQELEREKARGTKLVFMPGRWEENNYKNSGASREIAAKLAQKGPDFKIIVLESRENIAMPEDLAQRFIFAGHLSDAGLEKVMALADCGFCPTLWEGFNLPLAEMQFMGKPMFVLNIGAHPEIILDPWFLCGDAGEMAAKLANFLESGLPMPTTEYEALAREFRETFTWDRTARKMLDEFAKKETTLLVDVSCSAVDTANNGIIRLTRKLGRHLQDLCRVVFVLWNGREYVFPTRRELETLASYGGPLADRAAFVSPGEDRRLRLRDAASFLIRRDSRLLLPEIHGHENLKKILAFADSAGLATCAIFYDAIPWLRPDLCNAAVRANHAKYMALLASCDKVITIAEHNKKDLLDFWRSRGIEAAPVESVTLPGEFDAADAKKDEAVKDEAVKGEAAPAAGKSFGKRLAGLFGKKGAEAPGANSRFGFCLPGRRRKILFVSTLEPRKNHLRFYEAVNRLLARRPELKDRLEIALVGKRYEEDEKIYPATLDFCAENDFARHLGVIGDDALRELYETCDFTVYPSEMEGFGMPIMESIWFGKPCLCSESGSMGELGREGGCALVDVCSTDALEKALERLICDDEYFESLNREAAARRVKTWKDYAPQILDALAAGEKPRRSWLGERARKELAAWLDERADQKKILVCANFYPPQFVGGAEIIAHEQAKAVANRHSCAVVAFSLDHEEAAAPGTCRLDWHEGVPILRVNAPGGGHPYANYLNPVLEDAFARACDLVRPDIAHFHNLIDMSVALPGIAKKYGARSFVTFHDSWGFCFKCLNIDVDGKLCVSNDDCEVCFSRQRAAGAWGGLPATSTSLAIRNRDMRNSLAEADGFISPSRYLADQYVRRGFDDEKFHVVRNGLDTDRFTCERKKRDGAFRVGFCGYFGRHKGVENLIRAVASLGRSDIEIRLAGDGEERDNYRNLAESLGFKGELTILGKIPNDKIQEFYASLDVYCLPSICPENQPVSITEALASGVPALSTNMGGQNELVQDGENGFLFNPGDWKGLAEKLEYLMDNPEVLENFSRKARASAKNFEMARQAAILGELYGLGNPTAE